MNRLRVSMPATLAVAWAIAAVPAAAQAPSLRNLLDRGFDVEQPRRAPSTSSIVLQNEKCAFVCAYDFEKRTSSYGVELN